MRKLPKLDETVIRLNDISLSDGHIDKSFKLTFSNGYSLICNLDKTISISQVQVRLRQFIQKLEKIKRKIQ